MKKRLQRILILMGGCTVLCGILLGMTRGSKGSEKYIFVLLLMTFILCIAVEIGLIICIYRPFMRFVNAAEMFCKGKKETISISGLPEEFEKLTGSVNRIAERRHMLSLALEQSKYLGLQNQINPHFLYNTLDAIRGDALELHMDHIAAVTEALSTFFRYSVSNMEKIATLEEELGNVKDYFIIQQYRFGSRLNFELINKEGQEIYNFCLPRLSLQPLVENAIYHGLEGRENLGHVEIYLQRTEEELIICVIDDGVGMAFEQVDALNEMLSERDWTINRTSGSRQGIALNNVNERIKLLFGESYGLHIFSEENVGTEVRLIVPAISRRDYYQERISTD